MTAISVTSPGDEPAPVSHENDDLARKSTDNDVEMRDSDLEALIVLAIPCTLAQHVNDAPLPPLPYAKVRYRDHDPLDIIHPLLFLTTAASSGQPAQD
ncbi:hypothetical protein EDB83DRAFT_2518348 [Lactarius deliciosus]|nr:hypothetical protein EDB83DRAFT_2518348 [Lactarius deliciosus]